MSERRRLKRKRRRERYAVRDDAERMMGVDLRCGGGRVAALERPRRSIHYRSRSNPLQVFQKRSPRHKAGASLLPKYAQKYTFQAKYA